MGEYATFNGEQVKIGTCEDMYYLRADQRHLIEGYDFDSCLGELRFRFPFADEDEIEPGAFADHDHGVRIPGAWSLPAEYDHVGSVQFKAEPGYLLSIPCPEGSAFEATGLRIGRNGWSGGYRVKQQKWVDGAWWTVVGCGSCRGAWRLPVEVAETVADAFLEEASRTEWRVTWEQDSEGEWVHTNDYAWQLVHGQASRRFHELMGARILAGYVREEVSAG